MSAQLAFLVGLAIGAVVGFLVRDRLLRKDEATANPKSGGGPGEGGEGP